MPSRHEAHRILKTSSWLADPGCGYDAVTCRAVSRCARAVLCPGRLWRVGEFLHLLSALTCVGGRCLVFRRSLAIAVELRWLIGTGVLPGQAGLPGLGRVREDCSQPGCPSRGARCFGRLVRPFGCSSFLESAWGLRILRQALGGTIKQHLCGVCLCPRVCVVSPRVRPSAVVCAPPKPPMAGVFVGLHARGGHAGAAARPSEGGACLGAPAQGAGGPRGLSLRGPRRARERASARGSG